jgi:hypothetical protein
MLKRLATLLTVALGLALGAGPALATGCVNLPYTFVNGTLADAVQVNANFTALSNCVNATIANSIGTLQPNLIIPSATLTGATSATATKWTGELYLDTTLTYTERGAALTIQRVNLAPVGLPSNFFSLVQGLIGSGTPSGVSSYYAQAQDDPTVNTNNKGFLYGFTSSIISSITRNNPGIDDTAHFVAGYITPLGVFTGSITGTNLSVSGVTSGALAVNQVITCSGCSGNTTITALNGGIGGVGNYTVSPSQTVTSRTMNFATVATAVFYSAHNSAYALGSPEVEDVFDIETNGYNLFRATGTYEYGIDFHSQCPSPCIATFSFGAIRIPNYSGGNASGIVARNFGNTADIQMISVNGSDQVSVSNGDLLFNSSTGAATFAYPVTLSSDLTLTNPTGGAHAKSVCVDASNKVVLFAGAC